ncbi:MAG TPA: c-type cytochrome [Burkholderiaceae bacterium]|nr:c-type cytochrome [Burkholderiaceae bacterium]
MKTPRQLITVVVLAFIVPILIIILLVSYVTTVPRTGAGGNAMTPEATVSRIRPVAGFELRDASTPTALRPGDAVFKGQCGACHETGAAGAPKVGDTANWAPRIKQGLQTLIDHALKGKGAMPPQAGGEFADGEIARAVVYMANNSGAKFAEPAAPAAAGGAGADSKDAGAASGSGNAGAAAPAGDQKAAEPEKKQELTSGS